jgi:hypothetical protein
VALLLFGAADENAEKYCPRHGFLTLGVVGMAERQVILYFDDQQDALRFALAAGSVMSGEGQTGELIQETQRASRVRLDEVGNPPHANRSAKNGGNRDTSEAFIAAQEPKARS